MAYNLCFSASYKTVSANCAYNRDEFAAWEDCTSDVFTIESEHRNQGRFL